MEIHKKTLFLLIALHLVWADSGEPDCPSQLDENLSCLTDYNRTITCFWNSTHHSDHGCTVHAKRDKGHKFNSSCNLKPVDASRPGLQKCSMLFKTHENFQTFHTLSMNLTCKDMTPILNTPSSFKPACHIKLDPPPKPEINHTTVSWVPPGIPRHKIKSYCFQLLWKQANQTWTEASSVTKEKCTWNCSTKLYLDNLIRGERYEGRVRVKAVSPNSRSTWSDWSPTASWESTIGRKRNEKKKGSTLIVVGVVAGVALALFPALIFLRSNNTVWVYIVKRMIGPPLPNPAKSSLKDGYFNNGWSPPFSSFCESLIIAPVEIASLVDNVAPCRPEEALLEKTKRDSKMYNSRFSNPIYGHLSRALSPPAVLLTSGNLNPCAADSPYGPVCGQAKDEGEEQESETVRATGKDIRQLLSKGSNNSELVPIISDYEKVETLQLERFRLQSIDSGVCSGEEVSQESLEAESINTNEDGPSEREEGQERETKDSDFHKLFGGSGGISSRGSIQVCGDYEQVQNLQLESGEHQSIDSEYLSKEGSLDDINKSKESTTLLFPPSSSILKSSFPTSKPLSLNFPPTALSQAVRPPPGHILENIALLSTRSSLEPPCDGYMPVKQEVSGR